MEAVHRRSGEPSAEPAGTTKRTDARISAIRARASSALVASRTALWPLFDTRFHDVPVERLFGAIQVLGTFGLGYAAVELAVHGFEVSIGRGLLHAFFAAPALFVGGVAALRVALVFVFALVRIADNMEGLTRIADNVEDLGELPRWVRGLSPLRRLRFAPDTGRRGPLAPEPPARGPARPNDG